MGAMIAIGRGERLKKLRHLANLSRKTLCELSGVNINTLKGWEIARHGGLTEAGAKKLLPTFAEQQVSCSLEWLLHDIGPGPSVSSHYSPSRPIQGHENTKNNTAIEELVFFKQLHPQAVDFKIEDDAMGPFYNRGDLVAGIPGTITDAINQHCIIETTDGIRMLRLLKPSSEKNKFHLVAINPDTKVDAASVYNAEIVFAAPVMWLRRL